MAQEEVLLHVDPSTASKLLDGRRSGSSLQTKQTDQTKPHLLRDLSTQSKDQVVPQVLSERRKRETASHVADLIDGEANGVHVLAVAAVAAAVFLHQSHQ